MAASHAHEPDERSRKLVEGMAACGTRQDHIAAIIGIGERTLRKWYRSELDLGTSRANYAVARALFEAAIGGDRTAQIFWLKTRGRWSEARPVETDDAQPTTQRVEIVVRDDLLDRLRRLADGGTTTVGA